MRSSGSANKQSSTGAFEENNSSLGCAGSMMDDGHSMLSSQPSISDIDAPPSATPRAATQASLGHSAGFVTMDVGGSRLSLEDLREQSVPTMLGAGESGFAPGDYEEKGEEEREGLTDTTPTPGEQEEQDSLLQSQSTLRNSFG